MKIQKNKKAGFTLVELMVVAIIVAILAAVAIPLMSGNKNRAIATEGQAGCSTVATALRVYKAEHGDYNAPGGLALTLTGINLGDMEGRYFNDADYKYTPGTTTFKVTATATGTDAVGIIVNLDQDGVWTDTGTVKWK